MSDHSELVSTDSTRVEIGDTAYRVSISVRYNRSYKVICTVHRLRSTTPHDIIDGESREVREKKDVQQVSRDLVEWGTERAEKQEGAMDLNISVNAEVREGDDE